jgi:hypothetical protein
MTVSSALRALNGKADAIPVLQWDIMRGLIGINSLGLQVAQEISPDGPIQSGNPAECLGLLAKGAPDESVIFWLNAHRYITNEAVVQGIWNLREVFKARHATLILVAPGVIIPEELKHDLVVVTEALPNQEEIGGVIDSICQDANLPPIEPQPKAKITEALLGLSGFAAEQCLALSVEKEGIDLAALWERKRRTIEQTPGLAVWRGGETFNAIGGCENVKSFLRDILKGRRAPRAIAFIDEIEKCLAGAGGDLSGVAQDYLGALLTHMQDKDAAGCIFVGPPGAAKSAIAKAAGNEAAIPTVSLDLGAMKGSLVGQSERQLRQALQVIDKISQGQTLFIATCNSFGNLPPELKRRFTLGTFFFDLPSESERKSIWEIYRRKYGLEADTSMVDDTGWTGAEIRQCCDIAWRLNRSIAEATKFIVPVSKSAADSIEALRKQASGRFISASDTGLYQFKPTAVTSGRKLSRTVSNN